MASVSTYWPRYVRLAPGALIAAGLTWNALAPQNYWGDPMMAAACVVAGALLSLRHTVVVGAVIVVGVLALTAKDDYLGRPPGWLELANTLFAALIGVGVNRVVARHGRRLDVVRSVAEAAQRAVLPAPPARIGPLAVAACYRAAQVEAQIGGDAYAVQATPYGTRVLIADVRGKGLGAVGAVALLLGAFREAAATAPDLGELADRLERAVAREVGEREEELRMEGFITALLGEFEPGAGRLSLLSRGHPAAYLLTGGVDGVRVRPLAAGEPGLPLGMGALDASGPRPAPDRWPFAAGDTLLMVTDGVTEARDGAGVFYDPRERLPGLGPFGGPGDVIDALIRDVERWTGGPRDDDMAVLAVMREPGAPA
ncbi:PP2C family protein-serine/threonine phosphatase [Streptomyces hesseae]|uniref:PP2C family protein-serine/threonine phosphatase n=1 Tax=Streptomyces hesseae TaxID=3075519 RepID=A0ABU2SMM1_9ACTN|nr:PP2C family protein-serine/threonine phosphatase [Streptomyces sp. DSM 40473]MDT0450145.1 PP2C family protein-serine/threonine phosphatase [Streptomyces sp. DSM 40473]